LSFGFLSFRRQGKDSSSSSSSSSAALQPAVGFGLLYKLIPLISISTQLLPILHLEHFHIFEDSIDPSIRGSSCWPSRKALNTYFI
jgi:hypothetical protein